MFISKTVIIVIKNLKMWIIKMIVYVFLLMICKLFLTHKHVLNLMINSSISNLYLKTYVNGIFFCFFSFISSYIFCFDKSSVFLIAAVMKFLTNGFLSIFRQCLDFEDMEFLCIRRTIEEILNFFRSTANVA